MDKVRNGGGSRKRRKSRKPKGGSEWELEPDRRGLSDTARFRAALWRAMKKGELATFEAPAPNPVVERYVWVRKGRRLVSERDGPGWIRIWRRRRQPLGVFDRIVATDGTEWIVQPPQRNPHGTTTIPRPR